MDKHLSVDGLFRAQMAQNLDAARNGSDGKRRRERVRKPLRLPPELWEDVEKITGDLQNAFPRRYVTMNSTLEFIIEEGIQSISKSQK